MDISIIIQVIVALGLMFVFGYVQQRAKKFATKDQIGGITQIVENIKNDLERKSNYVQKFDDIEREAIMDFYVNSYQYLLFISTFPTINDVSSVEKIENFRFETTKLLTEHDRLNGLLALILTEDLEIDGKNFRMELHNINNSLLIAMKEIFNFLSNNTFKPNSGEEVVRFVNNYSEFSTKAIVPFFGDLHDFGKICRKHIISKFPE